MLVAISIPIFSAQLEKSRESTDIANIRSAYAAAQSAALTGVYGASGTEIDTAENYIYDISAGSLATGDANGTVDWFKGTTQGSDSETIAGGLVYDRTKAYTKCLIKFTGTEAPYTATVTIN